jgi:hypothetical protein
MLRHMLVLARPQQAVRPREASGRRRHLLRGDRDCDSLPALRAPALQDVPPSGTLHPPAKAVNALAANPARLVRPLHAHPVGDAPRAVAWLRKAATLATRGRRCQPRGPFSRRISGSSTSVRDKIAAQRPARPRSSRRIRGVRTNARRRRDARPDA